MTNYSNDAFLSHNGADKPSVEIIAAALEKQGVKCFLDKWDILAGDQWMRNLENELSGSRTILIFFGTNGIGPYQQAEADAALRRQIQQRQHCIIPVLLPGASPEHIAQCSLFLQGTNALKFHTLDDPLPHRLLAGLLRGEDPAHLRQWIRAEATAPADLLQTLQHWMSGLCFEWQENEYWVSEGQGKRCLNIPDLSGSFNADSIEYLLSWKSRLTDLIGREQELKALHDWTDSPNPISSRMIIGEGGTGKTRLAFEFARQLREQKGWQAGEAQGLSGCWYTAGAGTLLVIDYPEQRPEKVSALLDALARQQLSCKLRVLLLGRNGDFLKQLTQTAQTIMAPGFELTGLTAGDPNAWELFQAAWQQLHRRQQLAVPPLPLTESSFQQWQQRNTAHQRPLFVLALAIHRMLQPDARDLSAPAILRALVQQYEINRLVKEAKQLSLDPYSLVMLRALAGISGELPDEALRSLIQTIGALPLDIRLPALNQLKQTSLWSQTGIYALQPDLLAADLLHYALTEVAGDQAGVWQYCALAAAADSREASSILGRLIHDAQFILKRPWPLQALIEWVVQDTGRSAAVNAALRRNNLERTLLPLAIATDQSAVRTYEQLTKDNFAAYGPDLARSLNNLSLRLADSGKRAEGLVAIERAVAIHERLAEDNFAAYSPALASSLNNLSIRLAESGKRTEGLAASERAMTINEQLAQDNFAAYAQDLARSLNNLSLRLAESGRRGEGLAAIERAVAIYERLAQDNFAAYAQDLAVSLNNLSLRLSDAGRRAEGLVAIERAVAIREQLAQDNFAACGPALALSLSNLSLRLAESGKRAEGLAAIKRAVAIREQLAQDNFAAYGPVLAYSLNILSNHLGESAEPTADEAKRLMEIRAQLQLIKRRIRDEHIQVPAQLAWLFESASEPDDNN